MNPTPRRLIIDTDPGIDDAMAIAVALAAPAFEVLALTTVYGNHHVDVTSANAQRILDHLGSPDVPVVRGAARPLVRPPNPPATFVHGEDGLGDIDLPPPSRPPLPGRRAADFIVQTALDRPGTLTVATIGPLTNLALALRLEPELVDALDRVVVMGGAALVPGNVTPAAEANIWNDPEAAEIVFGAGLDLTMIGLDVTHQLFADLDWLAEIGDHHTPQAQLIARTAPTYVRFHQDTDQLDGIHCHDVATIAHLLRPDLFETRPLPVRVVTDGFAKGQTIVDQRFEHEPSWTGRPSVEVALGVDSAQVLELVRAHLVAPST